MRAAPRSAIIASDTMLASGEAALSDSAYTDLARASRHPIGIGGALISLVEPHPGTERAYNRWYERDHFYAGCMIGAWTVSGARFVATKECKERRYPADSAIAPF